MTTKHYLHFVTDDTLPAVARGLYEQPCDQGPVRFPTLGSMEWGALIAAGVVNGCGPQGYGPLVPDFTPEMQAAGLIHDVRYLLGGTEKDRAAADAAFARHAPQLYAVAVRTLGDRFFARREKPLSQCELLVIVQGAYFQAGYAQANACAPGPMVQRALDRQSAAA